MTLRRLGQFPLLSLPALAIAGVASAGSISILPAYRGPVSPSVVVTVDVVMGSAPDHVFAYGVPIPGDDFFL